MTAAPAASSFLVSGFSVLAITVAIVIVLLVHLAGRRLGEAPPVTQRWTVATAIGISLWMAATWSIAAAGVIAQFDRRPPPLAILLVSVLTISIVLSLSRFGTRLIAGLPLWMLVLSQAFRLPLEMLMHRAAEEGVMPVQMSYAGLNFDVLTGLTAIPVGWALARTDRRTLAFAWNVLGSLLLVNILTVAIISTPIVGAFGPDRLNTWVAYRPFVWLPTVMVVWALIGHLLVWRILASGRRHP